MFCFFFFFQAEDGIRDLTVTGVQTCALPIFTQPFKLASRQFKPEGTIVDLGRGVKIGGPEVAVAAGPCSVESREQIFSEIGRACVGKECRSRWSPYH